MTADRTLARTFAAHEQTVPDADVEFASLVARLDRHGRRRQYRLAASGLAVAGLVTAVAVSVLAAPSRPSDRVAAPKPSSGFAWNWHADYVPRPFLSIDAGWLPPGAQQQSSGYYADRSESVTWNVPYPSGGQFGYNVEIGQSPGDRLPTHWFTDRSGDDRVVAGRPARLFESSFGLVLVIDRGNGVIATARVAYDFAWLTRARALAVLGRVADNIDYSKYTPIKVKAVLTKAPSAGTTIVQAEAGLIAEQSTDYRLDDPDTGAHIEIGINEYEKPVNRDSGLDERKPGVVLNPGKFPKLVKGKPGRTVQGHDTVVWSEAGRTVLFVKGLGGQRTKLTAGKGADTLADLYRVADGIRVVA